MRRYLEDSGYVEVVAPHVTKATGACENVDTMFELDYFGRRAYLTQTGQLYLEVLSQFLDKVWCSIHSFRAEPRVDNRHLTEFVLVELEFLGGFDELLREIEGAVGAGVRQAMSDAAGELEALGVDKYSAKQLLPPYERLTYTEAVEELRGFGVKWGDDLKSVHERALVEVHGGRLLFITHYPKSIKFFNMKENPGNPEVVNSADLLMPWSGEAVGAAEREHHYERLVERLLVSPMYRMLIERGGGLEDFDWYLEFWQSHGGKL
ncbi:MAG: asparagine--tRNA ligase, partial [Thermoplasmata archaeon]